MPAVKQQSAEQLISIAIEKGLPVETMEKLLAMRRELKAEFAKEAYDTAMAKFQSECPVIQKKKDGGKTKSGVVAYKYAPLDDIVNQVRDIIGRNGFSYAIKAETSLEKVKVTCIVKHSAGHSESSEMEVPLSTKTDIMSAPQVVAATTTFAKRYAFCNAFGIMTGDEDTDAKGDNSGQNKIQKALEMIANSQDPVSLQDYLKKLKTSKMDAANRKALTEATENRLKEISAELDKEAQNDS